MCFKLESLFRVHKRAVRSQPLPDYHLLANTGTHIPLPCALLQPIVEQGASGMVGWDSWHPPAASAALLKADLDPRAGLQFLRRVQLADDWPFLPSLNGISGAR